jgi:hypothetical protein
LVVEARDRALAEGSDPAKAVRRVIRLALESAWDEVLGVSSSPARWTILRAAEKTRTGSRNRRSNCQTKMA